MHLSVFRARHIIAYLLGAGLALLLARVTLRLFAARPDNPIVAALLAITTPPQPLAMLDAAQPRFGAVLEFSTLALIVLLVLAGLALRFVWHHRSRNT